jgi:ribonuclease-3
VTVLSYLKSLFSSRSESDTAEELIENFHRSFGYRFHNGSLLVEAMTHRSYVRINSDNIPSNERLEFLGDSVLGLLVADYLYKINPDYSEGDLTKAKAMLVNETTLSMVGRETGLNKFIYLSEDEEKSGGRERNSIVSDAMEAVIGAIYLDGGLMPARSFIRQTVLSYMGDVLADTDLYNYKGELLEYLQARGNRTPHYEIISETGPDHEKTFKVAVRTNGTITGTGTGLSKKEAEQRAAAKALKELKKQETDLGPESLPS